MRLDKYLAVLILAFCSTTSTYGQNPVDQNIAEYPIKVHISAVHFRSCAGPDIGSKCAFGGVYADAMLDGKKVELFGMINKKNTPLILPGDYVARLSSGKPEAGGNAVLLQQYSVQLSNTITWSCEITGLPE